VHDPLLARLADNEGSWQGTGQDHAGDPFTAHLLVTPVAAGRGITLHYTAIDPLGKPIHEEILLVGPHPMGRIALWSLGSEIDSVLEHRLRRTDGEAMWVFAFGVKGDLEGFRQEVTLSFTRDGALEIQHAWGLPGEALHPGSAGRFTRALERTPAS
jgi:hypothetical protein